MCIDFKIFKVKVAFNFLGTVGFSARREGRYIIPPTRVESTFTCVVTELMYDERTYIGEERK
jgi:hypothetical protein